jgi:hypothetical protein
MRSRAAILPYPGDPFLLHYWLSFFDRVWGNEVDKLYIYLNSPIEIEVVDYIKELCAARPKINLTYNPKQIEHGEAINRTLDIVQEDYVMLIEDDAFIFVSGIVDACFQLIETGVKDIVGSKRGSCSQEILDRAKEVWRLDYLGEGDQGPNFWPNFFFCKKQTLLDTDRHFSARSWKRGERIEPLDYIVKDELVCGDTFVNTSLQLHAKFPQERIQYVNQYHASPDDLLHSAHRQYLFDGRAPWTHIGSLSSGVGGVLMDSYSRSLSRRMVDDPKDNTQLNKEYCQGDGERKEWERRVQMWLTFVQFREPGKIDNFANLYLSAINRIVEQYELSWANIFHRQKVYKLMLGL